MLCYMSFFKWFLIDFWRWFQIWSRLFHALVFVQFENTDSHVNGSMHTYIAIHNEPNLDLEVMSSAAHQLTVANAQLTFVPITN